MRTGGGSERRRGRKQPSTPTNRGGQKKKIVRAPSFGDGGTIFGVRNPGAHGGKGVSKSKTQEMAWRLVGSTTQGGALRLAASQLDK